MTVRRIFLLLLLVGQLAVAEGDLAVSEAPMKKNLEAVIGSQLEAFRADDYPKAYSFAHPDIKQQYPVAAFERMVKTGYPLIAKSVGAKFGLSFDNGDEAVVAVTVTGPNEQTQTYHYLLKRDGDRWRITGVVAAEKPALEV